MRSILYLTLAVAAVLAVAAKAQSNTVLLTVHGAIDEPLSLTASNLQSYPRIKLKAVEKGGTEAEFEGVSLFEIVNRAKPRFSAHCCSNEINTFVVIRAPDHYQATFTLPELDPKFGHPAIIVADRRDGQPLDKLHGPLEIIVPEDKVYARWVHQAEWIEVESVGEVPRQKTGTGKD